MNTRKENQFGVSVWEERDRLHIHLFLGDENTTIAEWWDDEARQMFEDGFFKRQPNLEQSVIDYAQSCGWTRHWVYGSGEHGCLYDNGPNLAWSYQDAVDDLASLFELGRTRKATLKRDGYLELRPTKDGASYCEIEECDCTTPEQHCE